ncbi:LysR family transcriptional regulator [bacterium]|nr:LysR family transcriptional regulator [bacterium]
MAHIKTADLNLLVVLDSLFRHSNVSSAAQELGLTQSAISHALSRLRDLYQDPLFVRVSRGVAPTEFAKTIRPHVESFIASAQRAVEQREGFDPARAEGRVTLSTTDYFEVIIGRRLYARLQKEAPGVQLSLRPTFGSLPKAQLEDGSCDLAVAGFYRDLPEGFYQQKLFTDTFSTAYRKKHPLLKEGLTLEKFYECEHALITLQGDFADRFAASSPKKKVRKLKYGSGSFTAPAWTVATSDLVLTGPSALLRAYQEFFPIAVEPCPIKSDPIQIQMVWHGLTNQDPLQRWIRQLIKEISGGLSP